MPLVKDKTYSLTVYLLKPDLKETEYLRTSQAAKKHTVVFSELQKGELFVLPSKESQPKWLSLFSSAVSDLPTIITKHASALLILPIGDAIFAVSFGYGRKLLSPGSWEEDFGLKVTLNSLDKDRIRSVDRTSFDSIGQHGRIQASREADISEFGLDLEQDMIRAVTGRPSDQALGRQLTGKDALHVTLPLTIRDLPELLGHYLEQYKKETYKTHFPWIDQIKAIKDPLLVQDLNQKLVKRLNDKDFTRLWLSIPEIVDWMVVEGFKYKALDTAPVHEDVHISEFVAEVKPRSESYTVQFLKRTEIYAVAADGNIMEEWPVYRCIYCEIDHDNETFLLNNGKWYRIGGKFLSRINDFYAAIPQSALSLPQYNDKSEGTYNERVSQELPTTLTLMDGKFIACDPPYGKVEFCDLYCKDKKVVHVKRYTGASAALSHLFAQATVSGTLFRKDSEFRKKASALLSDGFGTITDVPSPNEYEIVLAIISTSKKSLVLPFFSRVNLKNVSERLTDLGYVVTVYKIQA